jgi:hypothetical protein
MRQLLPFYEFKGQSIRAVGKRKTIESAPNHIFQCYDSMKLLGYGQNGEKSGEVRAKAAEN